MRYAEQRELRDLAKVFVFSLTGSRLTYGSQFFLCVITCFLYSETEIFFRHIKYHN
ncbi:hypothetical protein Krac_10980 [Ktedonobacter racemifer DSM 44963]|uniref:Uncharacterized protein n=1 Tax=Ktedonobacter racemifer DSM 44963 TaxID=485913 RepID=D6TJ18_KTERA|nr:hypothetical protein Krac_10980 [Ktedonobacter racemifer DSM 44963]